jgi:hypothetical protein
MKIFTLLLGMALVTAAHADVSDSGNLTIGGQGVIAGSMTVQGSGGLSVTYGVTASTLTASSATLTATGSSVYALTSSSGIHVLNGEIRLEQGAYIRWPDQHTSTTSSAGGGSVITSSFTAVKSGTITQTAPRVAVATVTFTSSGSRNIYIHVYGNFGVSAASGAYPMWSFLMDGALGPGLTELRPACAGAATGIGSSFNVPCSDYVLYGGSIPTAGAHSYAFVPWEPQGDQITYPSSQVVNPGTVKATLVFGVEER